VVIVSCGGTVAVVRSEICPYPILKGASFDGIYHASKRIDLPANWNRLVEKYQDIKPTYALY